MKELSIDIQNLSVKFGNFSALQNIDLKVIQGSAMALLGENGAGKTTTLRSLVNIYKLESGAGSILGQPFGTDSTELFQKIGYVSENQEMPLHWTIKQLLDYLKPQYPTWDEEFCQELIQTFDLPIERKLRQLSRGMLMKVSLLSSMVYRPELLILDEPFSGLDPLVREELIEAIIDLMHGQKWTIIISSHDVNEVEALCDSVTILQKGNLLLSESLDDLQARFRTWHFQASKEEVALESLPSDWINVKQTSENTWSLVETQHDPINSLAQITAHFGDLNAPECTTLSLKEIYLALAKSAKSGRLINS